MPEFVCSPEHIRELAIFAASPPRDNPGLGPHVNPLYLRRPGAPTAIDSYDTAALATFYADTLYQENIRSVRMRYPDATWDDLPGPAVKPAHILIRGRDLSPDVSPHLSPVALLKMCDCLESQSSETNDYRVTLAFELLDDIRRAAIRALPGYDEAPWEYTE
jgi:hypothetical protein